MSDFIKHMMEMFPDTVTVVINSPPDAFGAVTPISQIDYPARVDGKVRQIKDAGGQTVMSSVMAIFPTAKGLSIDYTYILPAHFVPRDPKPIAVGHASDETGESHERVYFFWTQTG